MRAGKRSEDLARRNTPSLVERVKQAVLRRGLIMPGERLGIGVSGGADSVALLRLMHLLQDELGIQLSVLHFQHGLRGPGSTGDEAFVAQLAAHLGLEFVRDCSDVAAWAKTQRVNLEDAGRQLRRAFFERVVEEKRVTRVATAHTADDQAETLLAHLLRGSGLAGLAGIYPQAGVIVRPLLEVRGEELREWLRTAGQEWREDPTNADTSRLRARVRRKLLPMLAESFQPQVVEKLCGLAELARGEEQFSAALAEARFQTLARKDARGVTLRADDLLSPLPSALLPAEISQVALSRRLVRGAVEEVLGHRRGLSARHVESVLRLAKGQTSGHRLELPHGLEVTRSFAEIVFSAGNRAARKRRLKEAQADEYSIAVALPERGSVEVIVPAICRRLSLKVVDCPMDAGETNSQDGALDAGLLSPPFLLRNWHPGDVFRPQGRRQARKLKEWLREARVPAGDRALWPVLESRGELIWVSGLPPAARWAAGRETRSLLLIREEEL